VGTLQNTTVYRAVVAIHPERPRLKDALTVAIAPFDRSPSDTVLSTLYGLTAVKQSADRVKEVRGVIFIQKHRDEVARLTAGLPSLSTFGFDIHVSLRA
jgi:hypothetical protein